MQGLQPSQILKVSVASTPITENGNSTMTDLQHRQLQQLFNATIQRMEKGKWTTVNGKKAPTPLYFAWENARPDKEGQNLAARTKLVKRIEERLCKEHGPVGSSEPMRLILAVYVEQELHPATTPEDEA